MLNVAIPGCAGRMGKELLAAIYEHPGLLVSQATVKADSPYLNKMTGIFLGKPEEGVVIQTALNNESTIDLIIDFTLPEAMLNHLEFSVEFKKPIVVGITGLTEGHKAKLKQAAEVIPVLYAPNMSVGINLMYKLIEQAAKTFGDTADIEIIEAHHRNKIDAPSGAAVKMGEVIANALDRDLSKDAVYGRQGRDSGPRDSKTIGFSSIRGGGIIGEHTTLFALEGEQLEINHKAINRATFAKGAVKAAVWLKDKPAGLYSMQDVLSI